MNKLRKSVMGPRFKTLLPILSLSTLLGACAVGPDYERPSVQSMGLPTSYQTQAASQTNTAAIERAWWTTLNDNVLNGLIEAALQNNTDLRRAAANIEYAQAAYQEATGALYPSVHGSANNTRSRASQASSTLPPGSPSLRNSRSVALSSNFEIDFWGKLRRARESAQESLLATEYARDNLELGLVKNITNNYILLRSLDAQISITENTIQTRQKSTQIVQGRQKAGLASGLDMAQAEGAEAAAHTLVANLRKERSSTLHRLALLSGQLDLDIPPGKLDDLPLPPPPPVGLPSELLNARPDIKQAEALLASANAQIGVAKAALFPSISLTGNFGRQSQEMSQLFTNSAKFWSFGPSLDLAIFDAGIRLARIDQANAAQKQALESYIGSIRTAFTEVRDNLATGEELANIETSSQAQMKAAERALELAQARYQAGFSPYISVLDAQRTANDAALALLAARQNQLSNAVNLYAVLGGGWQNKSKPSTDTQQP